MRKHLLIFISLFALMFVAFNAYAETDPVRLVRGVADRMIDNLKANRATLKSNPGLVYSLAYRIIVPYADLNEMSRRVLPPQTWNSASASQRSQFQREFTTVLVRTYASALAEYNDQSLEFYPVRGGYQGRSTVTVNSKIVRSDGPSIAVNYSLVLRGGGWKLYDMTVEGVSMLESFRSQFSDVLSQGNMDNLIRQLKQHNSGNSGR